MDALMPVARLTCSGPVLTGGDQRDLSSWAVRSAAVSGWRGRLRAGLLISTLGSFFVKPCSLAGTSVGLVCVQARHERDLQSGL